jgi:catechol 2,3-dioxygenase-like lactoylglutathione lyase family enzyme
MDQLPAERIEVLGTDHIYLAVSDMVRAEKFYDTVLSLLDFRKGDKAIAGDPHRHYFNRVMQISIRPARSKAAHDPYAPGLHHLCLQIADRDAVDRAHALLTSAGIKVSEPALYPEYAEDYYAIFFEDPDGLRFEIVARRSGRRLVADRWAELTTFLNPVAKLGR